MKIKLLSIYASPTGSYGKNAIINLPDKEARELVRGGYAFELPEEKLTNSKKSAKIEDIKSEETPKEEPRKTVIDGDQIIRRRRRKKVE